jgi:DNA-binding MarR family transcriptional regulator
MEHVSHDAAAVESAVESLQSVLDDARLAQSPAIPPTQLRVLIIIARGAHTNMSRLAEALDVVPSSASRLCDRLEATGMLRRVPDPRDRREVRLLLTPAARRLLDDLREARRRALAGVLERMTPSARHDLVKALQAFDAAVPRHHEDGARLRTA